MSQALRLSAAGLALACSSASAATGTDLAPIQSGLDYHSFANVEQFRVTRLELNLRVDFRNQVLFGEVALEVKRLDPRASELVLDTRDLDIRDVSERATNVLGALSKSETTWVSRPFHLDKADPILGSPLVIELPPLKKTTDIIKITYVTSPTAPALQWLTDSQTAGKHHPFMYTLSSPIGARSWIPLQDTPQVRTTYSAVIHTDPDLFAVMSAKSDPKAKRNGDYSFVMSDAIPSCLIALAVGDLRYKELGPRTGVYAEKPLLDDAAKEFADAEIMLRAAEKLFGPYRWDRYDIVVLPPSFPVADVGNPRAPFISPTVITGDRSLESVIAHALAEAWAGDLVTSATWRDAWINAGLAVYMKNRIVQEVYGEQRETMERAMALRSLRDELAKQSPSDQGLAIDFRGRDPGAASRELSNEKGGLFFAFLDERFGRERFDAFLKGYFDRFAFKSIATEQFLAYLKENLLDRFPGIVTRDQVTAWVMAPGIPAEASLPTTNAFEPVDAARAAWLAGKLPAKKLDTHGWLTPQWLYFLGNMPASLRNDQLADLDRAFGFTRTGNAQVAGSWFMLVIRNTYQPSYPRLEQYLQTTGRQALIEPLYVELMKTPAGATLAKRVYALARPQYNSRTAAALDAIVTPGSETQDDE
jgi:leukotriene-A4 hydrolase